ncbi:MAG: hypothetical protein M1825_001445 [Sarcosagium campestre]|nr:MAG: hypothetical protein M1825_001445 [Sarcosagium campestre]
MPELWPRSISTGPSGETFPPGPSQDFVPASGCFVLYDHVQNVGEEDSQADNGHRGPEEVKAHQSYEQLNETAEERPTRKELRLTLSMSTLGDYDHDFYFSHAIEACPQGTTSSFGTYQTGQTSVTSFGGRESSGFHSNSEENLQTHMLPKGERGIARPKISASSEILGSFGYISMTSLVGDEIGRISNEADQVHNIVPIVLPEEASITDLQVRRQQSQLSIQDHVERLSLTDSAPSPLLSPAVEHKKQRHRLRGLRIQKPVWSLPFSIGRKQSSNKAVEPTPLATRTTLVSEPTRPDSRHTSPAPGDDEETYISPSGKTCYVNRKPPYRERNPNRLLLYPEPLTPSKIKRKLDPVPDQLESPDLKLPDGQGLACDTPTPPEMVP